MEDVNYYLWLSIICLALAGFFTYKASEWSGKKVEQKLNENLDLSKEGIAKLDILTGEDSFPLALIGGYSKDYSEINFNVQLFGSNTLMNIQVWGDLIRDYSASDFPIDIHPFTLAVLKTEPDLKIERLINGSNQRNLVSLPNLKEDYCIVLFYQGNNTSWAQYIFRKRVDQKFETLYIVVDSERNVLFKNKSSDFPMTNEGYVYLNSYAKFKYENLENSKIDFHTNNLEKQ